MTAQGWIITGLLLIAAGVAVLALSLWGLSLWHKKMIRDV